MYIQFLLLYMILGSETPACHISDTQHVPHKRENTPTPMWLAPLLAFSVISQAPEVGPGPARCERSR